MMKLIVEFEDKEELLTQFERLKKSLEKGYLKGTIPSEEGDIYFDIVVKERLEKAETKDFWNIRDSKEVRDMREIIRDVLEKANCEDIDEDVINDYLFSLGFKVNQKVILL